jgi:hypothetical protein
MRYCCFKCRKVHKRAVEGGLDVYVVGDLVHYGVLEWVFACPDCATELKTPIGSAFEIPKKTDDKGWKQKEKLWEAGFNFSPCICQKEHNQAALAKLGVEHPSEVR